MNCCPQTHKIFVRYNEELDIPEEAVLRTLERSFAAILSEGREKITALNGSVANSKEVADQLALVITGFARSRAAAPAIREKNLERIRAGIFEFVRRQLPVEAQMLWSPKKHWISGSDGAVDLAELAALQTLATIDLAAHEVYAPGISFLIDIEDVEFEFMEIQHQGIVEARETYVSGMKRLIAALGLSEVFTLRRISDRAKNPEELEQWRQQMAENYRALENYWYDSEKCDVSSREALRSFAELRRLGWRGTIPPEMRAYYLTRLGKLADRSERQKVEMVLRNLSGILLHHQAGLLTGPGLVNPIKFSFVSAAAAAPAEMQCGRVDLRFAPRKLCSRVSAAGPWATKGFLSARGSEVRISFRGWHELADSGYRFAEGRFNVAGSDSEAEIRIDFLRGNPV